jgi:transposase
MGRRARRTFTKEYKAEVVGLVRQGDKTIGALSSDLGLTESAVRNWVAQAEIDAGKGPPGALTTAESQELAQLRRDNRRLRMERDILKKATAFFAKESR